MLRKIGIIAVLSLLALALAAAPALAVTNFDNAPSGAHYRQGSSEPVCTINQTTDTVQLYWDDDRRGGQHSRYGQLDGECHCQPHVHQ